MLTLILLLLTADVRPELVLRESVDAIELNHFYDEQGRLVFDQLIFYEWSRRHAEFTSMPIAICSSEPGSRGVIEGRSDASSISSPVAASLE